MSKVYLENKLFLKEGEEGVLSCPIELEYYLVESDYNTIEEADAKKTYGICIIKKTNEQFIEGKLISDFSCCISKTKEVLKTLAENSVTPITLYNILEDIVGT